MNASPSHAMFFVAFLCNAVVTSAFVGLLCASGGRNIVAKTPKAVEIFRMSSTPNDLNIPDKLMEEVWRYGKKPLLSVGGKGATNKHGNSLRQLLDDHTVVKVKVNTKSFGKSIRIMWQLCIL